MNEIPIIGTAYLPPICYFAVMRQAGKVLMEQCEHYIKQTIRSRCYILSANGKQTLSIPIVKQHKTKMLIRDVKIDHSCNWRRQHWRTIAAAYGKSPFFMHYADILRPMYDIKQRFLFDWNCILLQKTIEMANISGFADIIFTENYVHNCKMDFRSIKKDAKNTLSDILRPEQQYYQVFAPKFGFVPNLSIIDLLFNEGGNAISILKEYEISIQNDISNINIT